MRYEVLLLAVPEITADESSQLESQLREVIREGKGSCLSFERWGKFRLAYPVKKNEYGIYFLVRLEAENDYVQRVLTQVEALLRLKYNEIVMRYLVNKLHSNMSLAYQRPESLEDVPGKVADSLLREHRVEFDEGRDAKNETFTSEL